MYSKRIIQHKINGKWINESENTNREYINYMLSSELFEKYVNKSKWYSKIAQDYNCLIVYCNEKLAGTNCKPLRIVYEK